MSRLDEMQYEFMERHKEADLLECYPDPPVGNGKVIKAIYLSPEYKEDQKLREFLMAVVRKMNEHDSTL